MIAVESPSAPTRSTCTDLVIHVCLKSTPGSLPPEFGLEISLLISLDADMSAYLCLFSSVSGLPALPALVAAAARITEPTTAQRMKNSSAIISVAPEVDFNFLIRHFGIYILLRKKIIGDIITFT